MRINNKYKQVLSLIYEANQNDEQVWNCGIAKKMNNYAANIHYYISEVLKDGLVESKESKISGSDIPIKQYRITEKGKQVMVLLEKLDEVLKCKN